MAEARFREPQNRFLWAMLILDTVWDELKDILSFGVLLRRQRDLAIAPREVLVIDGAADGPSRLAEHVVAISRWWGLGSARALRTTEFGEISTTTEVLIRVESNGERRLEPEAGGFPKAWLLTCRHGHETALARRLRRHVRRVDRRGDVSQPLPFITAVPLIYLESTATVAANMQLGKQDVDRSQNWTPTLGIFDRDIDETVLKQILPRPPQLTWHGTVVDQGQNLPLTVSTLASNRVPNSHGTAVAAIAASKAWVEIRAVGYRDSDRKATWLPAVSASFLLKGLETLQDCDVINLSMTVDQTVSDVAARFEDALSWILEKMVDSGTIVVSAVGKARMRMVQEPSGDFSNKFTRTAGFPAHLPHVIAVGSNDPKDRNEGVLGPHIIVRFDPSNHLCTVDGEPFLGSSSACAYVSGLICNYLGASTSPSQRRRERAQAFRRHDRRSLTPLAHGETAWTNEVTYVAAT